MIDHAFVVVHFFFFKKSFRKTIRVSNGLNPDLDRGSVSPDLGLDVCKVAAINDAGLKY